MLTSIVTLYVGDKFHPTNSVAQGSPLSPLLYLLVIQTFISLINVSESMREHNEIGALEGITVPGDGGIRADLLMLEWVQGV